jgi:hypothetical protein
VLAVRVYVGAETTVDVDYRDLSVLEAYEEVISELLNGKDSLFGITFLGIVCIIMNPEIADPFKEGLLYRKGAGLLDIKPNIEYREWAYANPKKRIELVADAAIRLVSKSKQLPDELKDFLLNILTISKEIS